MSKKSQPLVTIVSFGYHFSGTPHDSHGHGGGFVLDCRCLPNPGKLPTYSDLDGRHPEVAAWLEASPLVGRFLNDVCSLVTTAATEYRRRGFEHLQVAFGCTGGRHRSVYCAERLHDMLCEQGVEATVLHQDLRTAEEQRGWGAEGLGSRGLDS
jgi:RNase adaptor protein for sRNA GlmZ degradation